MPPAPKASTAVSAVPRAERAEEDVPEAVELPEAPPMDLDTLIEDYNTRAQVFETDATAFNPRIEAFNQQAQALDVDARGLQALLEENPDGFSPGEEYDRALKTREALLERETALTTLQEQLSADQTRLGEEERQLNQLLEKIQLQEKEVAAKAWEHELPGSWEELADDHAAVVFVRMWDGLPLEDAKKEAYEKLKGIYAKKYAKPSRAKAATMLMAASADRQAALEELDVRSFVFKLGTSSSADTTDQIIQKHVKSLGLEAPPSAQTFKDTLTAAGINLEHLEQKIRVDNQNPAAVLHLETIRGGAVLQGVGPELVDRVNAVREGVARIEAQDKYIRTGDINTMMELDDPSFKFTEKDDSLAMGLNVVPGDAKFTDAQMIAASILLDKSDIGQQKRQVWEEYSGLLSHASTDNFVDAMTQIYARQFKLEAGAPNHEEKIQYFRERALRDVGALYVTGNWSGNRSISDRQLKGYQGDLLFGDALEQRIEVVGFDTDGEVLLRAVDGWMGGFEIVDIAHSGVAGVVREGSLGAGWSELFDPRDPSTSWDNFSTAWKRGMAQRDNTQQVGLDVIGSSPNMDTFDQLAWYLGGTAGWILTPDMITVAVGSLGRVVKKGLETPRRADLKKASKDFRIIAESRLNRTEEFAGAESRLRSLFPGQGDVADMLDIQEQLIAKRLSKQHPDIVDMDLAAKVPRGLNLSTGNRKAGVLMGEQAGTVATRYDELFNHPRHAQDLEDFAQKIKRGEIDPASDAVDKIADDLAESFSKRVAKKGATEEEVAAAKEKALAAIKAHPDDPAALQQSLMRFLENEVTTLKRLPEEPVAPKAPEPVKEPVEEPIKVTVDEAAWAQGGPTLLAKAAKESDEALSEALGFYRKRIARGEELEDFHKFNIRAIQEEIARRAAAPKPKVKAPKKPKLSDLEKQALKAGKARQKKRDSFIPAIEKMVAELSKTMDKALSKEELLEVVERAKAAVWINNEARAIAAAQMHYYVEGKLGKRVKPIKVKGFRDVPELDPNNPMSFEAIDFMDQAIDAGYSAKKAEKIARMLDDYAINHGNTYAQDPKAWWLKHDIKIVKGKIQIVDGKPTFKLKKRPPREKAPEKAEEPDVLLQRAEEITDTPEFKRWFGDSKVVDEKGKPLVVYHGTSAVFKDFSLSALGSAHGETTIRGLFFTPSPERASAYAVQTQLVSTKEHKALVKEVGAAKAEEIELSDLLDDLLTGQAKGSKWSKLIEDWGSVIPAHLRIERPFVFDAKGRHWSRELDHEILRGIEIAEGNFDGIHIKNIKDGEGISDNFIVFETTQIRSPFADPDVLFQGADAVPVTKAVSGEHPPRLTSIIDSGRYNVRNVGVEGNRTFFEYTLRGTDDWPTSQRILKDPDTGEVFPRRPVPYNPEVASPVYTKDKWGTNVKYKLNKGFLDEVPQNDAFIYRGMSWEEFEGARQKGEIRSLGEYNLGPEQVGLTYFTTDAISATYYASGFAPVQYKATPGKPAVVLAIPRREGVRVAGTAEHEIGLEGAVSMDEVTEIWVGRPYTTETGKTDVIDDLHGFRDGSGMAPSSRIAWKKEDQSFTPVVEAVPVTYKADMPGARGVAPSGIPGVSPAEFEETIKGFKDGKEAALYLAGTADSAAARLIASRISGYVENVDLRVAVLDDTVPGGWGYGTQGMFIAGRNRVHDEVFSYYNIKLEDVDGGRSLVLLGSHTLRSNSITVETLLHELIHAATVLRFKQGLKQKGTELSKVSEEFEDLLRVVIPEWKKANAKLPIGERLVGPPIIDSMEMLAWGLTNKRFQDLLAGIKIEGQSGLSKFVALIARLLGVSTEEKTALTEVIRLSDDLLKADAPYPATLATAHKSDIPVKRVPFLEGAEAVPPFEKWVEAHLKPRREGVAYWDDMDEAARAAIRSQRTAEVDALFERSFPLKAKFTGEDVTVLGPQAKFHPPEPDGSIRKTQWVRIRRADGSVADTTATSVLVDGKPLVTKDPPKRVAKEPTGGFGSTMGRLRKRYDALVARRAKDPDVLFQGAEAISLEEKARLFDELAKAQRGKPESLMLRIGRGPGSGLFSNLAEHIGDLTHRMSQTSAWSYGYELVEEKVRNGLRKLENRWGPGNSKGVKEEIDEGIERTLGYYKEQVAEPGFASFEKSNPRAAAKDRRYASFSLEEIRAEVKAQGQAYADAHRELVVHNRVQTLARDAAVALGEQRYSDAAAKLRELKKDLDKGPEHWEQVAGEFRSPAAKDPDVLFQGAEAVPLPSGPPRHWLAGRGSGPYYSRLERAVLEGDGVYKAVPAREEVFPAMPGRPLVHSAKSKAVKQGKAKAGDPIIDPKTGLPRTIPGKPRKVVEFPAKSLKQIVLESLGQRAKADEIKWTHLKEYLDDLVLQGRTSLTKEELSDYLRNSRVEVVETSAGVLSPAAKKAQKEADEAYTALTPKVESWLNARAVKLGVIFDGTEVHKVKGNPYYIYKDLPEEFAITLDLFHRDYSWRKAFKGLKNKYEDDLLKIRNNSASYVLSSSPLSERGMQELRQVDAVIKKIAADRPKWVASLNAALDEADYIDPDSVNRLLEIADEWALAKELEETAEFQKYLTSFKVVAKETEGVKPPRYEQFSVPGGSDYREILLRLPFRSEEPSKEFFAWYKQRLEMRPGLPQYRWEKLQNSQQNAQLRAFRQTEGKSPYAAGDNLPGGVSHWIEGNVFAHIRTKTRIDHEGRKIFFVEEAQSDWLQAAQKRGTSVPENQRIVARLSEKEAELDMLVEAEVGNPRSAEVTRQWNDTRRALGVATKGPVPDAPFRNTWHELAIKRVLQIAIDEGYDGVALTRGDMITPVVTNRQRQLIGKGDEFRRRLQGGGGEEDNVLRIFDGNQKFYDERLVKELEQQAGVKSTRTLVDIRDGGGFTRGEKTHYSNETLSAMADDAKVVSVPFIQITPPVRKKAGGPQVLFQADEAPVRGVPEARKSASEVLTEFKRARLVPTRTVMDILGDTRPEYLDSVVDFLHIQRNKVRAGEMTRRDIVKAWITTVMSMQAQAISVERVSSNLRKAGIEVAFEEGFVAPLKSGKMGIRPEEAAAAWMFSPQGQKFLDSMDKGVFDSDAYNSLVVLRESFGNATPTRNLGKPGKQQTLVNIDKLDEVVAAVNDAGRAGDTAAMSSAVRRLQGIGEAKEGFIKHLLGFGDTPTIDAVEINVWLTGKGNVGALKTKTAQLARDVKDRASSTALSKEVRRRITNRLQELQRRGLAPGIDPDIAPHIIHHWLWDKAKELKTTHEGMYRAQLLAAKAPVRGAAPKGAVELMEDGRATIYLFATADESTLVHELAHIFRRDLSRSQMDTAVAWVKTQGVNVGHEAGRFTGAAADIRKAEELWAEAFERYVKVRVAPNSKLARIFIAMQQWMVNLYRSVVLRGPFKVKPSADVERLFKDLLPRTPPTGGIAPATARLGKARIHSDKEMGETSALGLLIQESDRLNAKRLTDTDTPVVTQMKDLEDLVDGAMEKGAAGMDDVVVRFDKPISFPALRTEDIDFNTAREAYTLRDLIRLQQALESNREALVGATSIDLVLKARREDLMSRAQSPSEFIDEFMDRKGAIRNNSVTQFAKFLLIGGDINKGMWHMSPVVRQRIRAGVRSVQQATGEVGRIISEQDPARLHKYLGGELVDYKMGGRSVFSSGVDYMGEVSERIRTMVEAISPAERALMLDTLRQFRALPMSERGRFLETLRTTPDGNTNLFDIVDRSVSYFTSGQDQMLKHFVHSTKHSGGLLDPTSRWLFAESLIYASSAGKRGAKAEDATAFAGTSPQRAQLILDDIASLFKGDRKAASAVAVNIAGHGAAHRVRKSWVALDIGITGDEFRAMKGMAMGMPVPKGMEPRIQELMTKIGFNARFFEEGSLTDSLLPGIKDPIADTRFFLPRKAREKLSQALEHGVVKELKVGDHVSNLQTNEVYRRMWSQFYRLYKIQLIRGWGFLKMKYFIMNTMDNFTQIALVAGIRPAVASTARMIFNNLNVLPGVAQATYTIERLSAFRGGGGKIAERYHAANKLRKNLQTAGDKTSNAISWALRVRKHHGISLNDIMDVRKSSIRIGGKVYDTQKLNQTWIEEGIFSTFDTHGIENSIKDTFSAARASAEASNLPQRAIKWFVEEITDYGRHIGDTAEAWSDMERAGAALTLMETGKSPRAAATIAVRGLFDYAGSMTQADRHFLIQVAFPFWAFTKNANRLIIDNLFSVRGSYYVGVIRRTIEGSADSATYALYGSIADPYGVDIESLTPTQRDNYFAIRKMIEQGVMEGAQDINKLTPSQKEALEHMVGKPLEELTEQELKTLTQGYGSPGQVPEAVRMAVKNIFAGVPAWQLEGGKAYSLPQMYQSLHQSGYLDLSPGDPAFSKEVGYDVDPATGLEYRIGDKIVPKPDPAQRRSYHRHRTGIAVTMPMVKEVSNFYRAIAQMESQYGYQHPYPEMFLPESTIDAAWRYQTSYLGTLMLFAELAETDARAATDGYFGLLDYDLEDPEFYLQDGIFKPGGTGGGVGMIWEQLKPMLDVERLPAVELFQALVEEEGEAAITAPVRVSDLVYNTMDSLIPGYVVQFKKGITDPYSGDVLEKPRNYVVPGWGKFLFKTAPFLLELDRFFKQGERTPLEEAISPETVKIAGVETGYPISEDERAQRRMTSLWFIRNILGLEIVQTSGQQTADIEKYQKPGKGKERAARRYKKD